MGSTLKFSSVGSGDDGYIIAHALTSIQVLCGGLTTTTILLHEATRALASMALGYCSTHISVRSTSSILVA
jgi:hypothetical protein